MDGHHFSSHISGQPSVLVLYVYMLNQRGLWLLKIILFLDLMASFKCIIIKEVFSCSDENSGWSHVFSACSQAIAET